MTFQSIVIHFSTDEATFVGMYYFGGKANNLAFSAYQVQAQELQVQFGVTVDGCYPVEEIVTGRTGTSEYLPAS